MSTAARIVSSAPGRATPSIRLIFAFKRTSKVVRKLTKSVTGRYLREPYSPRTGGPVSIRLKTK